MVNQAERLLLSMIASHVTLADELRERLRSVKSASQYWLAISGPPGSGKSTLGETIAKRIGKSAIVIPMDGYHFYRSELDAMPDPDDAHRRRGAPFTFNAKRFVEELTAARETGNGIFPSFAHGVGDPIENSIRLDANQHSLIIVEGNYLLLPEAPWSRLKPLFDESWFLDAPEETIRPRLIKRSMAGGRDQVTAENRVESNDIPNARLITETCRPRADRIIGKRTS